MLWDNMRFYKRWKININKKALKRNLIFCFSKLRILYRAVLMVLIFFNTKALSIRDKLAVYLPNIIHQITVIF